MSYDQNSAMASQSKGIQQLLAAEKEAADVVADARKRKTKRLKQAKEEAQREIEQFRSECEKKFKDKQMQQSERADFQSRINDETDQKLSDMKTQVSNNQDEIINRVLSLVYDIQPELHINFRS